MGGKIGIVTMHRSRSYGACLQALALLETVTSLGYDAEFINYVNTYEQRAFKGRAPIIAHAIDFLRWKLKSLLLRDEYWRNKAFGDIGDIYNYRLSAQKYMDISQMSGLNYDILLAGSDQIWNPEITNGVDSVFLLDFGQARRRISYASSMGSHVLTDMEKAVFKRCMARFDGVSVREEFARNQLAGLVPEEVFVVIDPTLLLEKVRWEEMADSRKESNLPEKGKYVATYFVNGSSDLYYEEIMALRHKTGLPVYNVQINEYRRKGIDRAIAGLSVLGFLALIRDSAYVLSDSFHATVFSVIFEKDFLPLSNASNPIRICHFLEQLKLAERIGAMDMIDIPIDYTMVKRRLGSMRQASLRWLSNALRGENHA